jgi:hypothetical protein
MAEFRSRNSRVKKATNTTQQRQYREASDDRLKGNKGQVKKKAGAQGGGKSGLNIPR